MSVNAVAEQFPLQQMSPMYRAAAKRYVSNTEDTVTFTASTKKTFKVSRGVTLANLDMELRGTYTTPAVPAGTIRQHNPYELIELFKIKAGDYIHEMSGLGLHVLQNIRRKVPVFMNGISATEAGLVSTATNFNARAIDDFNEPGPEPGHFGCLPTGLFGDGQVVGEVYWAAGVSNLVDGAAGGTTLTNCELGISLTVVEHEDVPPAWGYGVNRIVRHTPTGLTVSNSRFQIDLGKEDGFLHYVVLIMKTGANANLSNALLTSTEYITLKVGGAERYRRRVSHARALQRMLFPQGFGDGTDAAFDGILVLPFIKTVADDGGQQFLHEALYLPGTLDVQLEIPLVGAATNSIEILMVVERKALLR